jgi:hypothetical protein
MAKDTLILNILLKNNQKLSVRYELRKYQNFNKKETKINVSKNKYNKLMINLLGKNKYDKLMINSSGKNKKDS